MPSRPARETLALLLRPEVEATTDEVLRCLLGDDFDPPDPKPPATDDPLAHFARYDYDPVLDDLTRFARALHAEVAVESEAAVAVWRDLERQPHARRLILVRHRRRLRSWGLFNLLLESSGQLALEDPEEAGFRAELALELVGRLPHAWLTRRQIEDLRASALRSLANAQYHQGEIAAGAETLGHAWAALHRGTGDLFERAHLLCLQSRLAAAGGDLAEAVRLLGPARAIYQRFHETDREGRLLVEQAELIGHRNPAPAAGLLCDALELIDPERDPRAALAARHLLAWLTNDLDKPFEARRLVNEARRLYLTFPADGAASIHRRWLEGRILRNLDLLPEAESVLAFAMQAFEGLGIVEEVILCGLDLLELYGHAGRSVDAARLDLDFRRRFEAWALDREVTAAWALAAENPADRGLVREVAFRFRGDLHRFLAPACTRRGE